MRNSNDHKTLDRGYIRNNNVDLGVQVVPEPRMTRRPEHQKERRRQENAEHYVANAEGLPKTMARTYKIERHRIIANSHKDNGNDNPWEKDPITVTEEPTTMNMKAPTSVRFPRS